MCGKKIDAVQISNSNKLVIRPRGRGCGVFNFSQLQHWKQCLIPIVMAHLLDTLYTSRKVSKPLSFKKMYIYISNKVQSVQPKLIFILSQNTFISIKLLNYEIFLNQFTSTVNLLPEGSSYLCKPYPQTRTES